jgi:Tfp pilus assembly protein PilO
LIKFAILKHAIQTLQAELAETKETQALLTAQLEATQKQMADMYQIIQSIGQASGVQVQLLALAPVRHFTRAECRVKKNSTLHSCQWLAV